MGVLIGGERFWLWRAVDDEGEVSIFWSNDNVTRTRL
jgi:transposase-like protein